MSKRTVKDWDGNNLTMVEHFTIIKHQHKLSKPWGNIRRRMWMARHHIPVNQPAQPRKIYAPWTLEQVARLYQWQTGLVLTPLHNDGLNVLPTHPYTCCGHDGCDRGSRLDEGVLIPNVIGWSCPCGKYKQDWCYESALKSY